MVSKACIVGMYQRKLEELASLPGIELVVAVPPYWREGASVLPLERMYTSGYELLTLPMVFNGSFHIHFYRGLEALVRRFKPEILHIDEEPYNLATFQAMHLARKHRARALFFTWQNLQRHYPFPFSAVERYNLTHAQYAIAGNREAEDVLRAKGYLGPIKVLPQFGVDPQLFQGQGLRSRPEGEFIIGYMGRLVEEKGVQVLLRAVSGLDGAWRVRLIGSGPFAESLRTLSVTLGIQERVDFISRVPSAEAASALRGLDTLVLPSLTRRNWKEQFGRVLIEAMACEVPVVGSCSGEIPNLIADAGLVVQEGDETALGAALRQLMQDVALRTQLGRKGRARVLSNYTQQHVAAVTHDVYRQMLASAQFGS